MKIELLSIELSNFKGHETLKINDMQHVVKISGRNGEGKSSIGDAITWTLYGTDTMGNQLDPTPLYEHEGDIMTTLLLQVDEKNIIKLQRAIEKGKNHFYVNDIPNKATEYKELIDSLFEKNLFLSIFNPSYFPSQNWKDQRAQLLQYIEEPFNKEVFEHMNNAHKNILEEPLKKHSLNELDKLHKDRFKKHDRAIDRVGARVATLREQYEKVIGTEGVDITDIKKKLLAAQTELEQGLSINRNVDEKEKKIAELDANEKFIKQQIMKKKQQLDAMKATPEQDICECCGQPLDFNARETARIKHEERLDAVKQEGKELVQELESIKKQREDAAGERVDLSELYQEIDKYKHILLDANRIEELAGDIKYSEEEYETIRTERNESQSILQAIKEFVDVKASLMVDKVNSLFDNLTVKLFEEQKNDSLKQTFELQMNGTPYCKLSTAEKIHAGMQLVYALQQLSGLVGPTFIDNAESVLNLELAPLGQKITATVQDHELSIEGGQLA